MPDGRGNGLVDKSSSRSPRPPHPISVNPVQFSYLPTWNGVNLAEYTEWRLDARLGTGEILDSIASAALFAYRSSGAAK